MKRSIHSALHLPVLCGLLTGLSAFLPGRAPAQAVSIYASAPGAQTAQDSGYTAAAGYTVQTEGFEGVTASTSGTAFPSPFTSSALTLSTTVFTTVGAVDLYAPGTTGESRYGGYNQGNFLAVPSGGTSSVTVTLNAPVSYLGFLFPAADAGNTITFYDGNSNRVGTFSTSALTTLLKGNPTLTSIDGQHTYQSSSYYGQPTSGFDSNEPYAFLSFVGSGGGTISKVVLSQSGTSGLFEADNFTLIAGNPAPLGTLVYVGTVPEPGTCAMLVLATAGAGVVVLRRRRGAF